MTLVALLAGCIPPPVSRDTTALDAKETGDAIRLREVAAEAGVDFLLGHNGRAPLNILEVTGHGGAFIDYDQDGWLDILLLGPDRVRLFRNLKGKFQDVSRATGIDRKGWWVAAAAGDYDNDGWPDLYLSGHRCRALLRNVKGAAFRDVTAAAGLPPETQWGSGAAFADLDQDGSLDLFVCHYLDFGPKSRQFCVEDGQQMTCGPKIYPPSPPTYFRNAGNGRFLEATSASGLTNSKGRGLAALPADLNGDGKTDLIVANDTEPADHFRNLGGGKFRNVNHQAGTALADDGRPLGGMALDSQDYDRDGLPDLAISTFETEPKCLWRNLGNGQFQDQSSTAGLDPLRPLVAWGMGLVDFDNDGWLDLLTTNGHVVVERKDPDYHYAQPLKLFRGAGGAFEDITATLPGDLRKPLVGRAAIFGDYDNDGRVDALISNVEGRALLLRNESTGTGAWLTVRLRGSRSNRQGLGSRVEVAAGSVRWIAEARTARSAFSASDPRVHFGMGAIEQVDRITVRWPSGLVTTQERQPINREIEIREPAG